MSLQAFHFVSHSSFVSHPASSSKVPISMFILLFKRARPTKDSTVFSRWAISPRETYLAPLKLLNLAAVVLVDGSSWTMVSAGTQTLEVSVVEPVPIRCRNPLNALSFAHKVGKSFTAMNLIALYIVILTFA